MLTKRIIPCLDVTGGRVVKGVSFVQLRDAGDPVELARFYDREGADELVFLDITASSDARDILADVVERVSEQVFIPLTVGGGLRTIEDIRRILEAGADKVSLNTAAVQNPDLISQGAERFGSQCIVIAIDAKKVSSKGTAAVKVDKKRKPAPATDSSATWEVYTHGGRNSTGMDAVKWAVKAEELGAGEVLLTSMDCDGQQTGYDLGLTKSVAEAVNIPVIASGGAGWLSHFYDVLTAARADAVLAASMFHYGTYSIRQAKVYLEERGLPVRL